MIRGAVTRKESDTRIICQGFIELGNASPRAVPRAGLWIFSTDGRTPCQRLRWPIRKVREIVAIAYEEADAAGKPRLAFDFLFLGAADDRRKGLRGQDWISRSTGKVA
jgi:hypothetical protein